MSRSNPTQAASGSLPNLINGISQQPSNIRFPNQADACVNHNPNLQTQLDRRNPLEITAHLEGLASSMLSGQPIGLTLPLTKTANPYVHFYKRDDNEFYMFVFTGETVKVFDVLTGLEVTFNNNAPFDPDTENYAYLVSNNPAEDFFCYTYKDTTWVVNRSFEAAMMTEFVGTPIGLTLPFTIPEGGNLSPTRDPECLIIVDDISGNLSGNDYTGTVFIEGASENFEVNTGSLDSVAAVANSIETRFNYICV